MSEIEQRLRAYLKAAWASEAAGDKYYAQALREVSAVLPNGPFCTQCSDKEACGYPDLCASLALSVAGAAPPKKGEDA